MDYNIKMDVTYAPLEAFDAGAMSREDRGTWWNQSLCRVNDCVTRLGIFEGEFHWHKHDQEDEIFFVLEGHLLIDLEGRTVELDPHQGICIPKGVLHRPRAPQRTVVLMVEGATVTPTGD
jgi:mannose-6-phosphate isomerase-like protein (cupin superfamily)